MAWNSGLQIRVMEGRDQGRVYPLEAQEMTLGRALDPKEVAPGWVLFSEPTVSRVHAILQWNEGRHTYLLQHRSRTNPTLVDGKSVEQHFLQPGQRIQLGLLILGVEAVEVRAGKLGDAVQAPPARRPDLSGPVFEALSNLAEEKSRGPMAGLAGLADEAPPRGRRQDRSSQGSMRLLVAQGPDQGVSFNLQEPVLVIGRRLGPNDVRAGAGVLLQDEALPAEQALLVWQDREFTYGILQTDSSPVMTRIRRVISGRPKEIHVGSDLPTLLYEGDVVMMGQSSLVVRKGSPGLEAEPDSAQPDPKRKPERRPEPEPEREDLVTWPEVEDKLRAQKAAGGPKAGSPSPPPPSRDPADAPQSSRSWRSPGSAELPSAHLPPGHRPSTPGAQATPRSQAAQGSQATPRSQAAQGSQATPRSQTAPRAQAAPKSQATPGAPRAQAAPRSQAAPGAQATRTPTPPSASTQEPSGRGRTRRDAEPVQDNSARRRLPANPEPERKTRSDKDAAESTSARRRIRQLPGQPLKPEMPTPSPVKPREEDQARRSASTQGPDGSQPDGRIGQAPDTGRRIRYTPPEDSDSASVTNRSVRSEPERKLSPAPVAPPQERRVPPAQADPGAVTNRPIRSEPEEESGLAPVAARQDRQAAAPEVAPGAVTNRPLRREPEDASDGVETDLRPVRRHVVEDQIIDAAPVPLPAPVASLAEPEPPPAPVSRIPEPQAPVSGAEGIPEPTEPLPTTPVEPEPEAPQVGGIVPRGLPPHLERSLRMKKTPAPPITPPPSEPSTEIPLFESMAFGSTTSAWRHQSDFLVGYEEGSRKGQRVALLGPELSDDRVVTIGAPGERINDIEVDDPEIANDQAILKYRSGRFTLVNSRTEIQVNSLTLGDGDQVVLMTGDRIHLGRTVLVFLERRVVEALKNLALEVVEGGQADLGRVFELNKERLMIGRGRNCDIRLADPEISRVHCVLVHRNGRFYVQHRSDTNPTFINGISMLPGAERQVVVGDRIQVSSLSVLQFRSRT